MIASSAPGLRLRPLPLSELADETFRIYRRRFPLMFGLSLILLVPLLAIQLLTGQGRQQGAAFGLLRHLGDPSAVNQYALTTGSTDPAVLIIGSILVLVITLALAPLTTGALIQAALDAIEGVPSSLTGVLRRTLSRYPALTGVMLALFGASLVALCLVGIWALVGWLVAIPVLLEERVGPGGALARSWHLIRGRWWRTFGILVVLYLLVSVVSTTVSSFIFLILALPGLSNEVVGTAAIVVSTLVNAVLAPVWAVAITLIYFDLRVRVEAIDLQLLAMEASAKVAPQPVAGSSWPR